MPSTAKSASQSNEVTSSQLLVLDADPDRATEIVATLRSRGFRAAEARSASKAEHALKDERPGLLVLCERSFAANGLRTTAAEAGVPLLVVVDDARGLAHAADRLEGAEDWVSRQALEAELPARVAQVLRRQKSGPPTPSPSPAAAPKKTDRSPLPSDAEFFALVVHDLRTPLNVIGLSLRMISQAIPQGDPDLEEDIRFVDENFHQIERMLAQLSDFYRLYENENQLSPSPFSPRRFVGEILESRANKAGSKTSEVVLDVRPDCPGEVDLDPLRARQAIQYALVNANASANGEPIRLTLRGGPDRWVIEVAVDRPAPPSVQSVTLSPHTFERLCGFAAERRGMDLAISAKVSEMFGGTARLEVVPNKGTTLVFDWPARLAPARPAD